MVQPADTDNRKEQAKKPFVGGGGGTPTVSHHSLPTLERQEDCQISSVPIYKKGNQI